VPVFLYHFGDHDPSGLDIDRYIVDGIREIGLGGEFYLERVAVTEEQIVAMGLPTRPTKTSDTRSGNFKGESVEVDAIKSRDLLELCDAAIARHVDGHRLEQLQAIEAEERRVLYQIAEEAAAT
jgi:hypothetical protein